MQYKINNVMLIFNFLDCDDKQLPLVVVQYSFLNGEAIPLKIESHGNAKDKDRVYIRTQHSTPKAAVKDVYGKAGGVMNAKSLSEIPRDHRQAVNAKSHKSSGTSKISSNQNKDLVYDLLEQHFGVFVRNVSFDDTITCVLASEQQLRDMERFCANHQFNNASVLGIDPTFNLGDFYVTVTAYENLLVTSRKTGIHPVFVGPMLVHQHRTYETYFHFAAELVKYKKHCHCSIL